MPRSAIPHSTCHLVPPPLQRLPVHWKPSRFPDRRGEASRRKISDSRPTLEWRHRPRSGQQILEKNSHTLRGRIARCSMPSFAARTRHWVVNLDQCIRCGHQAISYNFMPITALPKCQGNARAKGWPRARLSIARAYFHIVFTLPHELSALALGTSGCSTICSPLKRRSDARTGS